MILTDSLPDYGVKILQVCYYLHYHSNSLNNLLPAVIWCVVMSWFVLLQVSEGGRGFYDDKSSPSLSIKDVSISNIYEPKIAYRIMLVIKHSVLVPNDSRHTYCHWIKGKTTFMVHYTWVISVVWTNLLLWLCQFIAYTHKKKVEHINNILMKKFSYPSRHMKDWYKQTRLQNLLK